MILLFNTYVTEQSLNFIHGEGSPWKEIRKLNTSFRQQSKIDIFKYTIESYKFLPFTKQYFFYELDDKTRYEEVDDFIKKVFPEAFIHHKRADYQSLYRELWGFLNINNEWIFYSPNNDHPFNSYQTPDINYLISKGNEYVESYKGLVGIFYSHQDEFIHLPYKGNWFSNLYNNHIEPRELLEEDEQCAVMLSYKGDNTGIQIVHPNLFKYWFIENDLKNYRIIRQEDTRGFFLTNNQISIMPKYEICAHFDGQPSLTPSIQPPLFIPKGFFQNDIRIRYNKADYDPEYTNVSSRKKFYSFEDSRFGTDMISSIETLPLVWKDKIKHIL